MDYSAMVSLENTIRILQDSSRISLGSPSVEILQSASKGVSSLLDVFYARDLYKRRTSSESESERERASEMRVSVCELEDVVESHVSTQIVSQSESHPLLFSVDLQEVRQVTYDFSEMAKKMEEEFSKYSDNRLFWWEHSHQDDDDDEDAVASTAYFGGNSPTKMLGFTDMFVDIRDELFKDWSEHKYLSIVGMAGIGKTTLAKKILEDPLVMKKFECRFFVPVGLGSGKRNISKFHNNVRAISNQLKADEIESFLNKKWLVVFDDVWEMDDFPYAFEGLPEGSLIMVTTRLRDVADYLINIEADRYVDNRLDALNMRFMSKEESWDLLCGEMFGEELCPLQLEEASKKIAENCGGLPLLIVTVAGLLSKADKTLDHWHEAAADVQNPIFEEAFNQILEVLYPSYNNLSKKQQPCFIYMAVFLPNYKVRHSRLINLWSAEGFIDAINPLETYLEDLVRCNVVIAHLKGFRAKHFSLHSVFWYLAKKEARSNKFLHTLNTYADGGLVESIESQRHLSIYKNVLFSIKDVYKSVASVSNARSLLCTGAYHQYQVPICFASLRLLRVLDTLTIRFYEFPMEVLKLVLLRYFSITYNGSIPSSISDLWSLQYLIVYQHLSIKFALVESYLPVEIWHLQELEHLEIMGRNIPSPPHGVILPKLLKLLDVGPQSCTESVLESIPNLEKLRVQIELTPAVVEPSTCIDHIFHLFESKSLQIIIINPEIVAPPPPLPILRTHLKKLTLNGFGYPWKELNKIAELPLEVLKLQCYAFRGKEWKTSKGFRELQYLLIEDTDLVKWTYCRRRRPFRKLLHLSMKSCYKLHEFPMFEKVDLLDCNSFAATYAKRKTSELGYQLHVDSSWEK